MYRPLANRKLFSFAICLFVITLTLCFQAGITSSADGNETNSRSAITPTETLHNDGDEPWSAAELVQPEELARLLSGQQKPIVLQTGFIQLYRLGHIPGAKYAGPGSKAEGLALLKKAAQDLPRDREIVFYCGCCPMKDCPNIRPAYTALRDMGFKKIRLLQLATNFTQDWALKGFPVEKGGA